MSQEVINAVILERKKRVRVYKHKKKDVYINYEDCKTEYKPHELQILPKD